MMALLYNGIIKWYYYVILQKITYNLYIKYIHIYNTLFVFDTHTHARICRREWRITTPKRKVNDIY